MPLVYACIAPHGDEIIPTLAGRKAALFLPTRKGMKVLAARMKEARPDVMVVATPHNLRLRKHIGVVTSEYSSGRIARREKGVRLRARCDVELAKKILSGAEEKGLPVVDANYGALEGPMSDLAMDWGTLIPLWFLLRGTRLKCRVVVVTPSRGIPLAKNFEFGQVVARTAEGEKSRVAFIASADQAHAHRRNGPYGFDRRAAEYDSRVVEAIRGDRLGSIMGMEQGLVEGAKPDSLWQMAMLAGAMSVVAMRGELVSYQVPTYFGTLCASFQPVT